MFTYFFKFFHIIPDLIFNELKLDMLNDKKQNLIITLAITTT